MEEKGKEEKAMLTTTPPSQHILSSTMLHRVPSKPDFVLYVYSKSFMFVYADRCSFFALHKMTIYMLRKSKRILLLYCPCVTFLRW